MKIFEKQNRLKLIIALCAFAVLLAVIILLILFWPQSKGKAPSYSFPSYSDDFDGKNNFVSDDANLKFDGTLEDEAWKNQRWLEVAQATNENLNVKMTSYFGKDGLYMAFDVKDIGVYFMEKRAPAINSGIQLYLSSISGADNIEGHGYEIMLTAGGKIQVKKFLSGAYADSHANIQLAVKTDGDINTATCKGYTMEVFFPYDMFGEERNSVYASPAMVRTMSEQGDDRQWYWFGEELKGSLWTVASTWWKFDDKGLVAHTVNLNSGDGGSVVGNSYVTDDSDYTFNIVPNEGYYATSVKVGDKEIVNNLLYKGGKAYYLVESAKSELSISAEFAKLPTGTMKITGKINDGKNPIAGASAWAVKNGYSFPLTIAADGSYSADVPSIEGIKIYAEAGDYIGNFAAVKAGGGKTDLVLRKIYLGQNTSATYPTVHTGQWDLSRLFENRARINSGGSTTTIMNSEIYSKNVYAKANITLPDQKGVDARAGFIFADKVGNSAFVALTMNGEKNQYNPDGNIYYSLQVIGTKEGELTWGYNGVVSAFSDPDAIRKASNSSAGIPIAAHYHDGVIDVWVNGEKIGYAIASKNAAGAAVLETNAEVAVGLHTWLNRTVYTGLEFSTNHKADTSQSVPGWDMSGLSKGTAKCLVSEFMTTAPLITTYSNKINVSGNIQLAAQDGKDTRAGFGFMNKQETQVFVMLSMNGEKSEYNLDGKAFYNLQIITQYKDDGNLSWNHGGTVTNISGWVDVKNAANSSTGVPFNVYYENGKFVVGINGFLVADGVFSTDTSGKNNLASDPAVKVNLVTAMDKVTFTNLKTGTTKPKLQVRAGDDWDTSKLSQGKASLKKPIEASAMLWPDLKAKSYISANIPMKKTGSDVRAGFRFVDEDKNIMFVSLLCDMDGKYMVQVITISSGGSWHWSYGDANINKKLAVRNAAKSETGLPFAAAMDNGKLSIWVNNEKIASDIIPMANEKDRLFKDGAKVATGLECWSFAGTFNNIKVADTRP